MNVAECWRMQENIGIKSKRSKVIEHEEVRERRQEESGHEQEIG